MTGCNNMHLYDIWLQDLIKTLNINLVLSKFGVEFGSLSVWLVIDLNFILSFFWICQFYYQKCSNKFKFKTIESFNFFSYKNSRFSCETLLTKYVTWILAN